MTLGWVWKWLLLGPARCYWGSQQRHSRWAVRWQTQPEGQNHRGTLCTDWMEWLECELSVNQVSSLWLQLISLRNFRFFEEFRSGSHRYTLETWDNHAAECIYIISRACVSLMHVVSVLVAIKSFKIQFLLNSLRRWISAERTDRISIGFHFWGAQPPLVTR